MSGRTLSGQTNEAFWNSVRHAKPMAVGLNCALGAADMKPYVANLASCVDCYVLCYPNAGLPNAMGGYDQKGPEMAEEVRPFCKLFAFGRHDGLDILQVGGPCDHVCTCLPKLQAFWPVIALNRGGTHLHCVPTIDLHHGHQDNLYTRLTQPLSNHGR